MATTYECPVCGEDKMKLKRAKACLDCHRAKATPAATATDIHDYDSAWAVLQRFMGMRADRYAGACARPPAKGARKVVGFGDLHAPFHDAALVARTLRETADADLAVVTGDFGDSHALSRYIKYENVPYDAELGSMTSLADAISATYPQAVFMEGNHDSPRLEKALRAKLTPDEVRAIEFLSGGTLSPLKALVGRYANLSVSRIPVGDRHISWMAVVGDAIFVHAERHSSAPSKAPLDILGYLSQRRAQMKLPPFRLIVQAHTHRQVTVQRYLDGRPVKVVELGCLCDTQGYQLSADMKGEPQMRGYVTFTQDADGITDLNTVRTHWFDGESTGC